MLHLKIFSLNFVFFFRFTLINVLFLTLILKHLHIIWWAIIFQEGKHASIILKNMDHVNEILIQKANVTNVTTRFCGSNLGNHFSFDFSIIMLNLPKNINKNRMVNFFYPELTIHQTKLDENDIRFPELSSSNTSDNSNEMSTFLELPKQNINGSKGNYFFSSDNGIFKNSFWIQ